MKTRMLLSVILMMAVAPFAPAQDNLPTSPAQRGGHIDMLVVAEQTKLGRSTKIPSEGGAASAMVFDGGYIEGGDAIAGEKPPAPDLVSSAITTALQSQGYTINSSGAPATVITYQWGLLRRRHRRSLSLTHLDPNMKARLSLVATSDTVQRLEEDILANRGTHGVAPVYRNRPTFRDALSYASDPRYFVVITAYDYSALRNRQIVPLWRVKLSAQETSTDMYKAIPALAANSGPFLDRSVAPRTDRAELVPPAAVGNKSSTYTLTADNSPGLDRNFVETLLHHEHNQFEGEDLQDWDEDHWDR